MCKRVGITQRLQRFPGTSEIRDTLDIAWCEFLEKCGITPIPIPNNLFDPLKYINSLCLSGVILTGGDDITPNLIKSLSTSNFSNTEFDNGLTCRDLTEYRLINASLSAGYPIIGICRGMQYLNVFHGGNLDPIENHSGNKHEIISKDEFYDIDLQVNSYHNFGISREKLGKGLKIMAHKGQFVEAFRHTKYNHIGLMWHPERNVPFSENDIKIFKKVFDFDSKGVKLSKQ